MNNCGCFSSYGRKASFLFKKTDLCKVEYTILKIKGAFRQKTKRRLNYSLFIIHHSLFVIHYSSFIIHLKEVSRFEHAEYGKLIS